MLILHDHDNLCVVMIFQTKQCNVAWGRFYYFRSYELFIILKKHEDQIAYLRNVIQRVTIFIVLHCMLTHRRAFFTNPTILKVAVSYLYLIVSNYQLFIVGE